MMGSSGEDAQRWWKFRPAPPTPERVARELKEAQAAGGASWLTGADDAQVASTAAVGEANQQGGQVAQSSLVADSQQVVLNSQVCNHSFSRQLVILRCRLASAYGLSTMGEIWNCAERRGLWTGYYT